jgi:putative salt-induced outer membrane protein YdiY
MTRPVFENSSVSETLKSWLWALVLAAFALPARADVLIATNGERFVGTVIEETTNAVVFQSNLGGRMTLYPSEIRKLERTVPGETNAPPAPVAVATNRPPPTTSTNLSWLPPGVSHDGADWVQLKSGEWLRGQLKYIQDKEVEFDSDELDEQTLKLKDVRQVYPARQMYTKFEEQEPVYGNVVISNDVVSVMGSEAISQPLELLTGITPSGGKTGIRNWSGKATVGISLQSGNNSQTTVNTSAELARRTPDTTLLLDYLGNYSEANNVQNANNNRVNLTYDIRLDRDWFVRPVQFEYYHDPLANISYRLTGGVGAGFYIFDRNDLEWTVSAGPGFQYTRFATVEPDQPDTASTPVGVFQSDFKYDLTSRLTFIQALQCMVTKREAGQYTHHAVTTLEFEIKRHLNLDVSFIWDYLQNPQTRSDGAIPEKSDYYLTVGFGVRF